MNDYSKIAPQDGEMKQKERSASVFDIYWLGLTIVIGGQIASWNTGLQLGFWEYFIAVALVSSGYICLCFCIAEMTSFLSFAGGSYGYVRCAMGPTMGYLIGFCESIEYILYVSASVVVFGELFPALTGAPAHYAPLYWLIFYVIALATSIPGGSVFWQFSNVQAMLALLLILVYCLGGLSEVNLPKFETGMLGGGNQFMLYYPLASWFYVGVEAMTLTCDDIKDAGKQVPWAILACVFTLFVTCMLVYFVSSSLSPGPSGLSSEAFPLDPGYKSVFQANDMVAAYLALPGIFSTAFGFMFAYGRQLYSMSKSGLFPRFLSGTYGRYETPHRSLLVGSVISYLALLILYYSVPNFDSKIFNICMLGSCSVYIALARAYMICYDRYSNLDRQFRSPLGKWAAYWVVAVYSLMMVCLAFFQEDDYVALAVFAGFICLGWLYYHLVAHKREYFSEEEQKKFMRAYILNANRKRKKKNSSSAVGFVAKLLLSASRSGQLLRGNKVSTAALNEKPQSSSSQDKPSKAVVEEVPALASSQSGGVLSHRSAVTSVPDAYDPPALAIDPFVYQQDAIDRVFGTNYYGEDVPFCADEEDVVDDDCTVNQIERVRSPSTTTAGRTRIAV